LGIHYQYSRNYVVFKTKTPQLNLYGKQVSQSGNFSETIGVGSGIIGDFTDQGGRTGYFLYFFKRYSKKTQKTDLEPWLLKFAILMKTGNLKN